MKFLLIPIVFLALSKLCHGGPLRIQKRAAFYIANETACVVDNTVYSSGDPIPTDDPCESCKCRPPGFACVLKDCQVKPGCRAVRRAGHCCPEYICGCEHNGRMYRDGDEIRDAKNPCYTCHCQGSSIACAFVDCLFRVDCTPEYVVGECCPRYPQCSSSRNANTSDVAESTINPDLGIAVTSLPESETPLLEESKVEYANPETSQPEEKVAPETTVDSDSVSPYIPDVTKEEILERNNAGTTESEAATQSIPITETIEVLHDEKDETPIDLLNTESEIKKEYVEESGEEVSHVLLTTEGSSTSTSEPTVAGSNVEIFADETTTSNVEESYTTEKTSTINEEVEIEANSIEKTFRALKNFSSEGDSESAEEQSESSVAEEESESSDEERSESSNIEEKSAEVEAKPELADTEEKFESPEIVEKSETPKIEENESETHEIEEKSETHEIEEKSETQEVEEEKSETPEIVEESETNKESEKSETQGIEESESPESKELSDLTVEELTTASETQDSSSTSASEIKASEHTSSEESEASNPTTKNPDSLYYVDDKISPSESSETVTALVHIHEETSSQEATESKDASTPQPSSEIPSETHTGTENSDAPN